jgi:hypothetical protein
MRLILADIIDAVVTNTPETRTQITITATTVASFILPPYPWLNHMNPS